MDTLNFCRQLLDTAKRRERETEDELIRVKERHANVRDSRMEIEAILESLEKQEAQL